MDTKYTIIRTTELKGSTFRTHVLDFQYFSIAEYDFEAVFKNPLGHIVLRKELVKTGNMVHLDLIDLQYKTGRFSAEVWMSNSSVRDLAVLFEILITASNTGIHDDTTHNVVVTFEELNIPVSVTQSNVSINLNYDSLTEEQKAELKGDKGEPFLYEDFTPEQIANLQQPAIEAANLANTSANNANTAATNANNKADLAKTSADNATIATTNAITATSEANTATTNANNAATNAYAKALLAETAAANANTASGYKGDLRKSDPAPTQIGFYGLLETGVYTNLGGIDAQSGKLNFASFDGTTWSLMAVDIPIPNFVAPIDALNSTSTTSPLSANQGKILNDGKLSKGTYTGTASDLNTKIEKVETDYFEPKKNYFNVNSPNILVGKYLDSNGTVQNNATYNVTDFIEIPDDLVTGYKLYSSQNGVAVDMRFVNFYDANKVNMAASYSSIGGKSIAIPSGAKYIRISHLATYTNFQLEFGLAVTAYEPFTLILRNEKFILKSLPNDIVENSDIKNKAISVNKTDFISSTNLFNKDSNNVINSYFLTNTEALQANATYLISEYISVKSGDILSKSHVYGGGAYSNFYDINKVFISASNTQAVTAPQDGFIRVSVLVSQKDIYMLNIGSSSLPYSPYQYKLQAKYLPESADSLFVQSKMGKPSLRVTQASLADGGIILNTDFPYHLKKGLSMSFYADISSFAGSIYFGKGWQEYRGEYFTIDSTNIYLRKFDSVETTTLTVAHGLTLSTFIKFAFTVGNDGIAKVTLITLGGVFTANMQGTNEWNFKAFLRTDGQALSNITMTCASKDFQNSVWAFGDSYFGIAPNRHNYYLKEWGYFNFLLNGLAGQGGAGAYSDLLRCLNFGTPKYILWFLGMNDSNASYLSSLNSLKAYCESKGITLVIATIPTTPTQNKETIKSYVLASGLRYVDFYKAMGTNSSGVWYSGYLNSDNVHPDAPGAKALASQVLVDFPEIMQY